jgi:hypothetical protein
VAVYLRQNPFGKVVKCLSGRNSVEARMSSKSEMTKGLDGLLADWKKAGKDAGNSEEYANLEAARKAVPDLVADFGACSFMPGAKGMTQMQEAFSDWLAGEVIAKDAAKAKDTQEAKEIAFESTAFFLSVECVAKPSSADAVKGATQAVDETKSDPDQKKEEKAETKGKKALKNLETLAEAQGRVGDVHPFGTRRVEKIFLANPVLRKAMGCEGKGATCE